MGRLPRGTFDAVSKKHPRMPCLRVILYNTSHLHLHVLSADLCSEKMKKKQHYNSFHPKLGFFLDINDVLSWFDADESYFTSVSPWHDRFLLSGRQEQLSLDGETGAKGA